MMNLTAQETLRVWRCKPTTERENTLLDLIEELAECESGELSDALHRADSLHDDLSEAEDQINELDKEVDDLNLQVKKLEDEVEDFKNAKP